MEVWLLKVKHVYDEGFEDVGVFTSEEEMDKGRRDYLNMKKKDSFGESKFRFTHSTFTLNKIS